MKMMNNNTMSHKGYMGSIETSLEDACLHGRILHITDLITYEGETVPELVSEFKAAIDRYLAHCQKIGKEANKPFSGSFNVRIGPELHRSATIWARERGQSLNDLIKEVIQNSVDQCFNPKKASLHLPAKVGKIGFNAANSPGACPVKPPCKNSNKRNALREANEKETTTVRLV